MRDLTELNCFHCSDYFLVGWLVLLQAMVMLLNISSDEYSGRPIEFFFLTSSLLGMVGWSLCCECLTWKWNCCCYYLLNDVECCCVCGRENRLLYCTFVYIPFIRAFVSGKSIQIFLSYFV